MKDVSSSATALTALMKLHGIGRRNASRIVNTPPNGPDPERYRDVSRRVPSRLGYRKLNSSKHGSGRWRNSKKALLLASGRFYRRS